MPEVDWARPALEVAAVLARVDDEEDPPVVMTDEVVALLLVAVLGLLDVLLDVVLL